MTSARARKILITGLVGLNLLVFGASGLFLATSRRQYARQAAVNAQNLAQVLEQDIMGLISKVDVALAALAFDVAPQVTHGRLDPGLLQDRLRQARKLLPEMDGLRVADALGNVTYDQTAIPGPTFNVADRDYFIRLREHPQDGLLISRPIQGRINGRWSLILARRIQGPDGAFAGVALGILPLASLERLFNTLDLGRHGICALRDGTDVGMIARFPAMEQTGIAIGDTKISQTLRQLLDQGRTAGTYEAPSGLDRNPRTWAYRHFGQGRFYLFVGISREDYLAEWYREAAYATAFMVLFAVLSTLAAWGAYLGWRRNQTALARRRQLEQQLQSAQKMKSLGDLAGGVAHDMNNVLGAILAMASAHLAARPADGPVRQAFETIAEAATRGGTMVKSLLSFARQQPAAEQEVDLNALLQQAISLLEHTTFGQFTLVRDLADDLKPMRGDPGALGNVFMNILVNAMDAMPHRGVITLRSRNLGKEQIEVAIEDTGQGMTAEVLAKAVDPFFTTKGVGQGTGLGLALVYSTVTAHHGQLDLDSEPGVGTCVRMRFPAVQPAAPVPPAAPALPAPPREPGLEVLLVDDDELILRGTGMLLEVMGHRVVTATTGEEALDRLEGGYRPHVVMLDMHMPGLGAAGTLPRLRALCPDLPVLLDTGRADQAVLDLIAAHAQVTLLSKPFTIDELQAQLRRIALTASVAGPAR